MNAADVRREKGFAALVDRPETAQFGRLCLLARRLSESGVRVVQLYHGAGSKWDAHSDMEGNHSARCRESDRWSPYRKRRLLGWFTSHFEETRRRTRGTSACG